MLKKYKIMKSIHRHCVLFCFIHVMFRGIIVTASEFEFDECHDDLDSDPVDFSDISLRFPWLAFLQYVRIDDGTLHHGRVPRVVLVHRQFVLATTADAANLPQGHALGNVVFKEYDRDEEECGFSVEDVKRGAECLPAELVTPVLDVLLPPDHQHAGGRGIALLKLMQRIMSNYMVPICLPYFDFEKEHKKRGVMFVLDFESRAPLTMVNEAKYTKKTDILPEDLCNRFLEFTNVSEAQWGLTLCTSGCGLVSGAPLVTHLSSGLWVLAGLATHSGPCRDPDVWRATDAAPTQFVTVLPYVEWISTEMTGTTDSSLILRHRQDDPFGFSMLQSNAALPRHAWSGRIYRLGSHCFIRETVFYHYYKEVFAVNAEAKGDMFYFVNLQPETDYKVACVKVALPNRFMTPIITGLGHWNVSVSVPGARYVKTYHIVLEISAIAASPEEKVKWQQEKTEVIQKQQKLGRDNDEEEESTGPDFF